MRSQELFRREMFTKRAHVLPVVFMPRGQIVGHFPALCMTRPDRRLLRSDTVLPRRHLRDVVPKLARGSQHVRLLQSSVVRVVQGGLTRGVGVNRRRRYRGSRAPQGGRGDGGVGQGAVGEGPGQGAGGVRLLGPGVLVVEGGLWVLVLDGEGRLQGHGVEGVELLGVELFSEAEIIQI